MGFFSRIIVLFVSCWDAQEMQTSSTNQSAHRRVLFLPRSGLASVAFPRMHGCRRLGNIILCYHKEKKLHKLITNILDKLKTYNLWKKHLIINYINYFCQQYFPPWWHYFWQMFNVIYKNIRFPVVQCCHVYLIKTIETSFMMSYFCWLPHFLKFEHFLHEMLFQFL